MQRTSIFVWNIVSTGTGLDIEIAFPVSWDIFGDNFDVIIAISSALMVENSQGVSNFVSDDSELQSYNEKIMLSIRTYITASISDGNSLFCKTGDSSNVTRASSSIVELDSRRGLVIFFESQTGYVLPECDSIIDELHDCGIVDARINCERDRSICGPASGGTLVSLALLSLLSGNLISLSFAKHHVSIIQKVFQPLVDLANGINRFFFILLTEFLEFLKSQFSLFYLRTF